jgi:hypothetical protein
MHTSGKYLKLDHGHYLPHLFPFAVTVMTSFGAELLSRSVCVIFDAVISYDYIAPAVDKRVNVTLVQKYWWGKPKCSEKKPVPNPFFHHNIK